MGAEGSPGYQADAAERELLAWWKENRVFEQSVSNRKDAEPFVFLEGPPTANGMPHPGHVLTRTLKDTVCRYQTMRGHRVERRAGWDCHGLPVEIEVEKELGLKNKQDIEDYGVEKFNQKCRESVFRYLDEWVEMSERVGFWLDFDDAYVTLTNPYIESVWWSLKQAWDKNLLYQGHRVSPYCPRCGTALSSHEVAQGYKEIEEPSVFAKFRIAGTENEYLLAWTTTPWTLPGNVALAVGPDIDYVKVEQETPDGVERYILARACLDVLRGDYTEVGSLSAQDLEGMEYEPLFPFLKGEVGDAKAWVVGPADFVTTEDGSGIVHTAVMYGEEDYDFGEALGLPKVHTVAEDGTFHDFVTAYAGTPVKEADPRIIEDLREAGLLYRVVPYTHSYPFCWRCDTALLYYALDSWFLRMTELRDNLVRHNDTVNWYPGHIKAGRFGEFIGNVRDWALSRDRYWGTPLPVWTCDGCGHRACVGSIDELEARGGDKVAAARKEESLDLHKPFLDGITFVCDECQGTMRREPSVIDTWYDSGAAHFASWHYPFDHESDIDERSPADFVAEGLDQTRGWFYSLLATAAIVFDRPAYRNVVVNGLVLDDEGRKMSKSRRNYTSPDALFERFGADAVRWTLLSSSAPWADKRFGEDAVRESYARFVLTLYNTFGFYETYRDLDGWDPDEDPPDEYTPIDRWLRSRTQEVIAGAREDADSYQLHKATRRIEAFLVDDVSNWWLRRSRRRFWTDAPGFDKASAYHTLRDALATVARLCAPYAPFLSERIHRTVRRTADPESVHLCDYPEADESARDPELETAMQHIRELAEGCRAMRAKAGVKNRVPLAQATIVRRDNVPDAFHDLEPLLQAEANVKTIVHQSTSDEFEASEATVNQRSLGRTLKAAAKPVLAALRDADPRQLAKELDENGHVTVTTDDGPVEVPPEHFDFRTVEREGTVKAESGPYAVYLDTTLTPELEAEGWAREIVRRIQEMRKEAECEMEEEIQTRVEAPDGIEKHLGAWTEFVERETRSRSLEFAPPTDTDLTKDWDIEGETVRIGITRTNGA